jgi:hypothetical protein
MRLGLKLMMDSRPMGGGARTKNERGAFFFASSFALEPRRSPAAAAKPIDHQKKPTGHTHTSSSRDLRHARERQDSA